MAETVAEKFWRESHELRAYHDRLKSLKGVTLWNAVLKHEWTGVKMDFDRPIDWNKPQDLDEWLAEDNPHRFTHFRVPGVLEVLGIKALDE